MTAQDDLPSLTAQLNARFDNRDWPQFLQVSTTPAGARRRAAIVLAIGEELSWLRGHFPQQPVVPGIVQVDWAARLAGHLFDLDNDTFCGVDNLKFLMIVKPPLELHLELTLKAGSRSVDFCYAGDDQIYSKGKIRF
jgi:3-hydroxymyristoyl/3-hydroxydecanoyl-(acyl carrier protein) dehydratase